MEFIVLENFIIQVFHSIQLWYQANRRVSISRKFVFTNWKKSVAWNGQHEWIAIGIAFELDVALQLRYFMVFDTDLDFRYVINMLIPPKL